MDDLQLFFISLVISLGIVIIHIIIKKYLVDVKSLKVDYYQKKEYNLILGTFNGFGLTFLGCFGDDGISYRTYYFFTALFLPVIPLGCYRISEGAYFAKNHKYSTQSYKVYCNDRWRIFEIIDLYLKGVLVVGIFVAVGSLIAHFYE